MKLNLTIILLFFASISNAQLQVTQCAPDSSLASDSNCQVSIPDYTNLVIIEDIMMPSGAVPVMQSPAPGTIINTETTVVTFSVTDAFGGSASCEMIFTMILDPMACLTYIPDDNFEQALIDLNYDTGTLDNFVPTANINTITNLNIGNKGIVDPTGIEDFIALESLQVNDNNITTIDLTNLVNLISFRATRNNITTLDLNNQPNLEFVIVDSNELSALTINSTVLKTYQITGNNFTTIDLSVFPLLRRVFCANNDITSIDFSANPDLETIECQQNMISAIDITANPAVVSLLANNNELESLNVKNGNNTILTNFKTTNNVNLTCVLVDDVTYSEVNWENIDIQTTFNETTCETIVLKPKVYLQGAALHPNLGEEILMRDDLRSNSYIPTTSPYEDALTVDSSVLNSTGTNAIVDWVCVELRDATDNTIIIDSQSALLLRDGDVVTIDGVSELSFYQPMNDYHIAIKHRNHLGIITSNAITLSSVATSIDFTDASNQITFGSNAQTIFGMFSGIVAMWSGNANNDTVIQYSGTSPDTPNILSEVLNDTGNFLNFPTYAVSGYNTNDMNMDGNTQYSGTTPDTPFILQNVLAHPGNFLNFSTYQIMEQLPEN
ncbi:hypothetical protein [uncultured Kordia sp.]|uniref:leucine-rich repeat domain-containing protein n=1 Tax=uncultured Kordia sp. TaxID=507699 RepID=UPI0026083AC4|nr:hypothetical protein [uncultured Kordia sp.]